MNRIGEDKYLSPWLFLMFGVIGLAVVSSVLIFYSTETNVIEEENEILLDKIAGCVIEDGRLIEPVLEEFDLISYCGLNEDIFKNNFYVELDISRQNGEIVKKIKSGNVELKIQCGLKKENEAFAYCSEKSLRTFTTEDFLVIRILTASNNAGSALT